MDWNEILEEALQKAGEEGPAPAERHAEMKLLAELVKPCLDRVLVELLAGIFQAKTEKENKMDIIKQQMQAMLSRKMQELAPEAREALKNMRVQLVRHADRIEIVIDSGDSADQARLKDIFLDSLLIPLSNVVAFFGCQIDVSLPQGD